MFTTVDPAGLRADLQLVSGVQSEGKLYEWLSMVRQKIPWPSRSLCAVPLCKVVPPLVLEAYKGPRRGWWLGEDAWAGSFNTQQVCHYVVRPERDWNRDTERQKAVWELKQRRRQWIDAWEQCKVYSTSFLRGPVVWVRWLSWAEDSGGRVVRCKGLEGVEEEFIWWSVCQRPSGTSRFCGLLGNWVGAKRSYFTTHL